MDKKILLAVDDTKQSKYAMQYVISMGEKIQNMGVTLLHIQPHVSQFLLDEAKTSFKAQAVLDKLKKKNKAAALKFLEKFKNEMVYKGFSEKSIEIQTRPRKSGLAKDIIDLAQEKRYDAVVVGRRGLTRMQEMFMSSVTSKLVEHSQVIPLWVVDGKVSHPEKILVAVDGSESALRAIDHVSFILRNLSEVDITLFHVLPKLKDYCLVDCLVNEDDLESVILQGDKKSIEQFLIGAYEMLKEAGISEKQVKVKQMKRRFSVGDAIMEEVNSGGYGTVVIGRRGMEKAFYMGSVSNYILNKISEKTVWLVS